MLLLLLLLFAVCCRCCRCHDDVAVVGDFWATCLIITVFYCARPVYRLEQHTNFSSKPTTQPASTSNALFVQMIALLVVYGAERNKATGMKNQRKK